MGAAPTFNAGFNKPSAHLASVLAVYAFVRESIPLFVQDLNGLAARWPETTITDTLVAFLQGRLTSIQATVVFPFHFHHEAAETNSGNSSRNDFAAFGIPTNGIVRATPPADRIAITRFEAKRLDQTLLKARESEYVRGEYANGKRSNNSGGIERFKNKSHGSKEENGALVAYIQSGDTSKWLPKINRWIDEEIGQASDPNLAWDIGDKLQAHQSYPAHDEFESISARTKAAEISLHHFWIPLNSSAKIIFE